VAVEVWSREEGRRLVLDQCLLVRVRLHPEDDHVGVAFAGLRVDRVGARVAEEDERLAADLIDRVVSLRVMDGDVRHREG
jgi:hypothetical protein